VEEKYGWVNKYYVCIDCVIIVIIIIINYLVMMIKNKLMQNLNAKISCDVVKMLFTGYWHARNL